MYEEYEELYGEEDDYVPFNKIKKTKLREKGVTKSKDNKRKKKKKDDFWEDIQK